MKSILIPFFCVSVALSAQAEDLFDQLTEFNPNWQSYETRLNYGESQRFSSDKEYIQTHLTQVLKILRSNEVEHLTCDQLNTRKNLITVLEQYKERGLFPMNYYRYERIPVFIDEHNTHCAVGYLLMETGFDQVAHRIAAKNNYAWVKEIDDPALPEWQQYSGFTLEELKLIQGAYDYYAPFARVVPNKTEIPQKPEVVSLNFKGEEVDAPKKDNLLSVWCYGEGQSGVLHGKWIQNYREGTPWIEGYFENGKRTGSWKEYYQGTNILCRTEHWRNDKLNGVRTRYDREGNVIERITFKDGEAVKKINYDLQGDLEFIRRPIDSITLETEVYSLSGYLLARGKEQISNPSGQLQWFQDIELTALNTFAITARDGAPNYTDGGMPMYTNQFSGFSGNGQSQIPQLGRGFGSFQQGPSLVNYIKVGEWKYYNEYTPDSYIAQAKSALQYLTKDFPHFGVEISEQLQRTDLKSLQQSFDSLQVQYENGGIADFKGFANNARTRLRVIRYTDEELLSKHSIFYLHGFHHIERVKEIGPLDENGYRIGVWTVYDVHGQPLRAVNYLQPFKDEEPLTGSL
ncbi:MAG: hypothetical protein NXI10_12045 [bacterium]|nr:hypothetical protein [bacterium]